MKRFMVSLLIILYLVPVYKTACCAKEAAVRSYLPKITVSLVL